jgi:hypothetical protein
VNTWGRLLNSLSELTLSSSVTIVDLLSLMIRLDSSFKVEFYS